MRDITRDQSRVHRSYAGRFLTGILVVTMTACGVSQRSAQRADEEVSPAWPGEFTKANLPFQAEQLPILRVAYPEPVDAEYVNDDELCLTCHQTYTESFGENVHRGIHESAQACEACHGPASRHLETRGKEPGTILSFKNLPPTQASEVCLKCHEENACSPGAQWRTSVHAHNCVTCTNCHRAHYNVAPGTPATAEPDANAMREPATRVTLASFQEAAAEHAFAAGYIEQPGRHRAAGVLPVPRRQGRHAEHRRPAPDRRRELLQLHHVPRCPRQDPRSFAERALLGVPQPACADDGLQLLNAQPDGRGLHGLPQSASQQQRAAGRRHQSFRRSPAESAADVGERPGVLLQVSPDVFAMFSLPSHHPLKEGKMFCGDCHDGHGQLAGEHQSGVAQSAVLEVPRRQTGPVRLRTSSGHGELCVLPLTARSGGEQPVAAAADVSLSAMPQWAPQGDTRFWCSLAAGTTDGIDPAPTSTATAFGKLLHRLHGVSLPDPRQ